MNKNFDNASPNSIYYPENINFDSATGTIKADFSQSTHEKSHTSSKEQQTPTMENLFSSLVKNNGDVLSAILASGFLGNNFSNNPIMAQALNLLQSQKTKNDKPCTKINNSADITVIEL